MRTLAQYVLHDVVHHLYDVTGQQDAAAIIAPVFPRLSRGAIRSARQRCSSSVQLAEHGIQVVAALQQVVRRR